MFMTLKCRGADDADEMQPLHLTDRLGRPSNTYHVACNSCRKKKLRCSREQTGCRRCQQRSIRCVYDTQRTRGNNKLRSQPIPAGDNTAQTEGERTAANQKGTLTPTQSPWRPSDNTNVLPADHAADMGTAPTTVRQLAQDIRIAPLLDITPGNSGSNSSNHERCSSTRFPAYQPLASEQDDVIESTSHMDTSETSMTRLTPHNTDQGLFYDISDEYLGTPSDSLVKLLDTFGTDVAISPPHHLPGSAQMSDSGSKIRSDLVHQCIQDSGNQQYLASSEISHACSNKADSMLYFDPSGTTQPSSKISPRDYLDLDGDVSDGVNNEDECEDCECTETALQILEEVVNPARGTDWTMVESKLLLLKNNISRFMALFRCCECRLESGIFMLTLVICEKLTLVFEEIAQWWNQQTGVRAPENRQDQQQRPGTQQDQPRIAMGRYQIDTAEEHRAVFTTIISLQLQRLSNLSLLLIDNSRTSKREAHLEYIETLSRRMKSLQEVWKS